MASLARIGRERRDMIRVLSIVFVATSLGACSTFPEIDNRISPEVQSAGFPTLLPVQDLRAQVATGPIEPREQPIVVQAEQIDNRADALRARAAGLRGDVIDEEDRDRLDKDIKIYDEEV
ncbi:MAG: hypothetical protein AAF665_19440 [Pseudomonadota bacterium]